MKIFKIRKKGTLDQFSSGGANPRWTKKGKSWTSLGHVKSHLQNINGGRYRVLEQADYSEAEIVEFTIVEVSTTDLSVVTQQIRDSRLKKEEKAKADEAERKRQEDLATLRRLQAKYPQGK